MYAYRKGFVSRLSDKYDLTIYCTNTSFFPKNARVIECKDYQLFNLRFQISPLTLIKDNNFYRVIVVGNLKCLSNLALMMFIPRYKLITWGFWATRGSFSNKVRAMLSRRARANVLYAKSHLKPLLAFAPTAHFTVGVNTIDVTQNNIRQTSQSSIVFVGSLNARKKIDVLISMFPKLKKLNLNIKLEIVGDGPCRESLQDLVYKLKIHDNVIFHGVNNDAEFLAKLYSRAIIEVSPGQAGLSVPMALGHATPFATLCDSISGGETESIINNYNGFIAKNELELRSFLEKLIINDDLIHLMKDNSLKYYKENLTIAKMISGFEEAFT